MYIPICLTNQLIKTFPFNVNNSQLDENAIYLLINFIVHIARGSFKNLST